MTKTCLVLPDQHAHPDHSNDRAIWLGELIKDKKPDFIVNLGDMADMSSLCAYDKGKRSFQGRTYAKDISAHLDFQDKLWSTVKKSKKKLPMRVALIGNHEQRIERAIETQPELEGVISYDDLELANWYDVIVPYSGGTPGTIELEGIYFAHYMVSGVSGRPISGEHHAYSLLQKNYCSSVVGHTHTFDYCVRTRSDGKKITGLCAGVYQDYYSSFAGDGNRLWTRGVVLLHIEEPGCFDIEMIGLSRIKKEYGNGR